MADIYLEGKLAKQDLVEAYKWGELASQSSLMGIASISGRSFRDAAILKMKPDQIEEARRRVKAFAPRSASQADLPTPADPVGLNRIKLQGISGTPHRRLAVINERTFQVGDQYPLKLDGKAVSVRCIQIKESSVIISIADTEGTRELFLSRR